MNRTLLTLLIVISCLALVISGCSAGSLKGSDLMADIKAAEQPANPDPPDNDVVAAINLFSSELLQASLENTGNILVSPTSVFLALAMTLNGADGETREAMLDVLANQNITVDMINQASRDWMIWLEATGEKTTVSIANSIWFRDGFEPYQPFLQTNADYFNAGAKALDFSDQASTDAINGWVDQATHGLIEKIVEKINPSTVMFLINTVYFKADWQTPFEKPETRTRSFQTPEGSIETDFMHRTDQMLYYADGEISGTIIPYDDGQYAFFALLPDQTISPREWLAALDPEVLFSKVSHIAEADSYAMVGLAIPSFEAEYEDSLLNELDDLGMGVAFDSAQADFSLINAQRSKGLYISEVKHKTFIRVDEKGTEAAAATSVAIDESAVISDVELIFDRPFIYGIMDMRTNTPLFVGILENPAE